MIIECYRCEAKVDARELGSHVEDLDTGTFATRLLKCPVCDSALVGGHELYGPELWTDLERVWPHPEDAPSHLIPDAIRSSLKEASACLKARAHSAAVAMTGRAIEGVCRHFNTSKSMTFFDGLKDLKGKGVIDKRLFEWSEALRKHRNLAAHASGENATKQDAEDLLTFANAICDYVFVLSKRFDSFMKRQARVGPKSST
jgi:hypothetical protein